MASACCQCLINAVIGQVPASTEWSGIRLRPSCETLSIAARSALHSGSKHFWNHGPFSSDRSCAAERIEYGDQFMSNHATISPSEAADRLAIRELVEAYAHCADRRDAKTQMSLFTADTHLVVYMNAKDPTPSQALHSREALAPSLHGAEQVRRRDALRRTEHDLHVDNRSSHWGSLLPCASRHART